jgi:hypothetical protein
MTAECCQAFTSGCLLEIFVGIDLTFIGLGWGTIGLAPSADLHTGRRHVLVDYRVATGNAIGHLDLPIGQASFRHGRPD